MAYGLIVIKPLPEPMLDYSHTELYKQALAKF